MSFSLRTHEYQMKGGKAVLMRSRPYIRLKHDLNPPIFVQEGAFFYENGEKVTDLPEWAVESLRSLSAKARQEVGLKPLNAKP